MNRRLPISWRSISYCFQIKNFNLKTRTLRVLAPRKARRAVRCAWRSVSGKAANGSHIMQKLTGFAL